MVGETEESDSTFLAMPRCDRRAISWGERKGGGVAAVSTDRRSCRVYRGTGAAQVANNTFLVEECARKRCSECGTDGEVAAVACDCFHGPVSDFSECDSHHVLYM